MFGNFAEHHVFCRHKNHIENACCRKRRAGILSGTMDNEEGNAKNSAFRSGGKVIAVIFGLIAIGAVFFAGFQGYNSPLFGAGLLVLGIAGALCAFIFGAVFGSAMARRFSYFAVVFSILITFAGIIALLFDKGFEDRCVRDWQRLSQETESLERRLEDLEDRFDTR